MQARQGVPAQNPTGLLVLARVRKKRHRGCLLVLCKDMEMSDRNWMERDIKSNPGHLNLGTPEWHQGVETCGGSNQHQ